MARVRLTTKAKSQLAALPRPTQEGIADRIDLLAVNPREIGYPLVGRLSGLWSCRALGNLRIIFRIEGPQDDLVTVMSIAHRSRAYGRRRP